MKEWIEDVKSHLGNVDRSLWIVDRLERLGISRYFEPEITTCLHHVYKYVIYHTLQKISYTCTIIYETYFCRNVSSISILKYRVLHLHQF